VTKIKALLSYYIREEQQKNEDSCTVVHYPQKHKAIALQQSQKTNYKVEQKIYDVHETSKIKFKNVSETSKKRLKIEEKQKKKQW
jgi:hypothetical protein